MIVFDLKCDADHVFEVWFRSSSDYEDQRARSLIVCPVCGSTHVEKAVMAPNVGAKGNQTSAAPRPSDEVEAPAAAPSSVPAAPKPEDASIPAAQPADAAKGQATVMPTASEVRAFVRAVHQHVTKSFDNVGDQFADEARAIHYGDAEERGIYGNATREDVEDLLDEGIEILPLPDGGKTDA